MNPLLLIQTESIRAVLIDGSRYIALEKRSWDAMGQSRWEPVQLDEYMQALNILLLPLKKIMDQDKVIICTNEGSDMLDRVRKVLIEGGDL